VTDDRTPEEPEANITGELEPVSDQEPTDLVNGDSAPGISRGGGLAKVIIQGVAGLIVLYILAANPGELIQIEEVAAFALIVFGSTELFGVVRQRGHYRDYIQPAAAIVAGLAIWVWPAETRQVVGFVLGAVVAIRGIVDAWSAIRRRNERGANAWVFIRGIVLLAIGGLIFLVPEAAVPVAVIGGSIVLISRAIIGIAFAVSNRDAIDTIDPSDTYAVATYWLSKTEMDPEDVEHVDDRVFLHRGDARERITRFSILMGLATAIATFGIGVDSTAVVIGAMLVAPLMTPILGVSAGLINGRSRSASISGLIVLGGATGAVAIAWALSALIPDLSAVVANSQVTSRTAPSLLDLAIAIAAGAAGAYGVSRKESTDALPGVAVAIALIPPLAVVGITLQAADYSQAAGATLLFLTNLFSIVLMAGIVFLLVGYSSWSRLYYRRNRIRTSFALVVLAVVLITIPLVLTGENLLQQTADLRNASSAVDDWLEEGFPDVEELPLRINSIEVDGDTIVLQLIGYEIPPPSSRLAYLASEEVGRPMTASIRWIEERLDISVPAQLPEAAP
jgi:uncharacterized hydrophobic protein (TIGR00271 family)